MQVVRGEREPTHNQALFFETWSGSKSLSAESNNEST